MVNKIKTSQFVGRQMSRLKAGLAFIMIFVATMTSIGVMKMAFPDINTWILLLLFPFVIIGAFFIGYVLDIWNVTSADQRKTFEMAHRYLNNYDLKSIEFNIILIRSIFEWMQDIQKGKPIDSNKLEEEYKKYIKKWS